MDRASLDKLIFYFNNVLSYNNYLEDDIKLLDKIYLIIGKARPKEYKGVNDNTYKYLINNINEIIVETVKKLGEEDRKYFLEQLPKFIKISLLEDKKKLEMLNNLKLIEKKVVIQSLNYTDDEKIDLLNKLENDIYKIEIIKSIQDDDKKIELLRKINNEKDKTNIISTIYDDNKKIQLLKSIESEINKSKIIKSLQNDDLKIELLKQIEKQTNKALIIESIKDDIKKVQILKSITREETRKFIIESIKDDDLKIELLKTLKKEKDRADVIKTIQDDDKKIKLLDIIEIKMRKIFIIETIDDDSKKIEFLKNIENEEDRISIFKTLQTDDKKIEALDYIKNLDKKLMLIVEINDVRKRDAELSKIDKNLSGVYRKILDIDNEESYDTKYKDINIPLNMTFGIEIECAGKYKSLVPRNIGNWKKTSDDSIGKNGIEVISPIMNNTYRYITQIYKINEILQNIGLRATEKCGGHVHIGADFIQSEEGFRQLMELWGNAEEVYFLISNKAGEPSREGVRKYAYPISSSMEDADLEEDISKDDFIEDAKKVLENDRNRSLNIMNINNGKNTIEFRLSNGTLDANTWLENIRLYGRTVQVAEKLGKIVNKMKAEEELTQDEKTIYALKEMLKQKKISLDTKMEILMKILFNEEERVVYQERYEVNKQLAEEQNRISKLEFGKVDLKKEYNDTKTPEEIVEFQESTKEEEQR